MRGVGVAFQMTKLVIRIDFEPSGSSLGPSMIGLLEALQKEGSIRKAAKSLNISYRKAWLLIQQMQKTFSGPVVLAEAGGYEGGSTQLTDLGLTLLKHYHSIENYCLDNTREDLEALATLVRHDAPPRRREQG
jgi:molybdate transport system regulatory protein